MSRGERGTLDPPEPVRPTLGRIVLFNAGDYVQPALISATAASREEALQALAFRIGQEEAEHAFLTFPAFPEEPMEDGMVHLAVFTTDPDKPVALACRVPFDASGEAAYSWRWPSFDKPAAPQGVA